jgi:DNA-binding transcriptional regulator GbsR (MarR family)
MVETEYQTAEKRFVEEVGLFFEQLGWPRMAGRVLGRLLIAEPSHQSACELAEALMASKGSISSVTRLLINYGMIERLSLPGVRRDYFHVKPCGWDQLFSQKLALVSTFRGIIKRGLELLEGKETSTRQWLEGIDDLYGFLERQLPLLLANWEQERLKSKLPEK